MEHGKISKTNEVQREAINQAEIHQSCKLEQFVTYLGFVVNLFIAPIITRSASPNQTSANTLIKETAKHTRTSNRWIREPSLYGIGRAVLTDAPVVEFPHPGPSIGSCP